MRGEGVKSYPANAISLAEEVAHESAHTYATDTNKIQLHALSLFYHFTQRYKESKTERQRTYIKRVMSAPLVRCKSSKGRSVTMHCAPYIFRMRYATLKRLDIEALGRSYGIYFFCRIFLRSSGSVISFISRSTCVQGL